MNQPAKKRRNTRNRVKFNPNREHVQSAVAEYLKNGGTISRVKFDININENSVCDADFFLRD